MADVTLAECNGQAWLLEGEQYIDGLLANMLPPHVTIEVVQFQSKYAIDVLWEGRTGEDPSSMWMIHPGILNRVKGQSGLLFVQFAEWSAAMDDRAAASLRTAAEMAAKDPDYVVALIRHAAPDAGPMVAEMGKLRSGLIEARLTELGVAPGRMVREVSEVGEGTAERIEVIVRPA